MLPLQSVKGMRELWILGHLLFLSAEDIKERQVSLAVIGELGVTGVLGGLTAGRLPQPLPGLLLLAAGYCSKEMIGYGDGWLLVALGMWLSAGELFFLLFLGMGLAALSGTLFHRKELPLVPYLTAAYVIGAYL